MGLEMRLKPPSGFRDFEPKDMILRKKVINILENIFIRYGFDPIETPVIEHWEVFEGKYGKEAESKLMYRFKDPWSDKWFALRFDLTVPMARFFSLKRPSLPFKRYHIGRVWRHERPQKGRYREFWQADVDIVGSVYPEADAELLDLSINAMLKLGFKDFVIKLNDRRILRGIFEEELALTNVIDIYRAIDKLDKIGYEGVKEELKKIGLDEDTISRLLEIISKEYNVEENMLNLVEEFPKNNNVREGINHLLSVIDYLGSNKRYVSFSLSLVRGLDYYTGPVWEIILRDVQIGSVAGGGRYDDLIEKYAGASYPATGTSFGVERLIDVGKQLGIFRTDKTTFTEIYIISMTPKAYKVIWNIASELRKEGFSVQIDLMRRSERKQREYASKKGIPILIIIGEKELSTNEAILYIRDTGERIVIKRHELRDFLSAKLRKSA